MPSASSIWTYFEKVEEEKSKFGKCKKFSVKLRSNKSSTSSLRYHLKHIHPVQFAELIRFETSKKRLLDSGQDEISEAYVEKEIYNSEQTHKDREELAASTPGPSKRRRLLTTPNTSNKKTQLMSVKHFYQKYSSSDPRQLAVDMEITKYLVRSSLPFSHVDKDSFRDFVHHFDSRAIVKQASTFSKYKLPLLYDNIKSELDKELKNDLSNVDQVGFTTDCWTSRSNDSYYSLTIHYVNDQFKLKSFCLGVRSFEGRHTAIHLAKGLDDWIAEISSLNSSTLRVCVHDAAANITSAVPRANQLTDSFTCLDHIINTVLIRAVQDTPNVKTVLEAVTKLSSRTHQSSLSRQAIRTECSVLDVKYIKIITPGITRWNSNAMMVESVLRLRPALESLREKEDDLADLIPSSQSFNILEALLPIMLAAKEMSEFLSSDTTTTSDLALISLYNFIIYLERKKEELLSMTDFIDRILFHLEKRIPKYGTGLALLRVGHLLNPRYRGAILKKLGLFDQTVQELIENDTTTKGIFQPKSQLAKNQPKVSKEITFLKPSEKVLFELSESNESLEEKTGLEAEIDHYLALPRPDSQVISLNWWEQHSQVLPLLSKLARATLCVPVSSAASERAFSASGNIITSSRHNLDPKTASHLIFVQQNYSKIKVSKWNLVSEDEKEHETDP